MDRTLQGLIVALVLALVIFAIWPGLDLDVAHRYYVCGNFLGQGMLDRMERDFFRVTPYLLLIALTLACLLKGLGFAVPYAPSGRATLFLIATMAIGPGLVVNLGLKDHWHRPRPVHVQEFGGEYAFKPWFRLDGGCAKNCSFASGEAAQGFWMAAPALIAPLPWRPVAIAAALLFGVEASDLRLEFGGHFLSDVVVGGLLALIVVQMARRAIWPKGGP